MKEQEHNNIQNFEWDIDKFYDQIRVINGVMVISIPHKLADFGQYKEGDVLEIWIRKKGKKKRLINAKN